jgi:hypothetical protein
VAHLLGTLGVRSQPSDMSFSVRSDRRDFEYGSAGLSALFAQRQHLWSPRFHRMWRDILRFYRESRELLAPGPEIRLDAYLRERGYSEAFIADHLLPLVGAVWSSNRDGARDFPARLLVRFFDHHGFLQRDRGLQWLTIAGGSREYVRAWQASFRGTIRLACPVERAELRPAAAAALEHREAETLVFEQRAAVLHERRHDRDLRGRELEREAVLLGDRRGTPALRPVKLRDQRRAVLDADLVHAVLVAVQRKDAPVGDVTERLHRRDDDVGREAVVRMRVAAAQQ